MSGKRVSQTYEVTYGYGRPSSKPLPPVVPVSLPPTFAWPQAQPRPPVQTFGQQGQQQQQQQQRPAFQAPTFQAPAPADLSGFSYRKPPAPKPVRRRGYTSRPPSSSSSSSSFMDLQSMLRRDEPAQPTQPQVPAQTFQQQAAERLQMMQYREEQARLRDLERQQQMQLERQAEMRRQEEQRIADELMRQQRLQTFMNRQRALGIPDTLYVQLDDQQSVPVYRFLDQPQQFWRIRGDARGGVGEIFATIGDEQARRNRPWTDWTRLRWVRLDETDPVLRQKMTSQADFSVTPRPPPPSTETTKTTTTALTGTVASGAPILAVPAQVQSRPQAPPRPAPARPAPRGRQESSGLSLDAEQLLDQETSRLAELRRRRDRLREQLESLDEGSDEQEMLEGEMMRVQEDVDLAREMQKQLRQALDIQRVRIRREREERLKREMRELERKRARELEAEEDPQLAELERLDRETRDELQRLQERERETSDPDARAREREAQRRAQGKRLRLTERKIQRIQAVDDMVAEVKRRLFRQDRARPRSLVELVALLDNMPGGIGGRLRDFASTWDTLRKDGEPVDPVETLLEPDFQRKIIRAYMCGYVNSSGDYVKGFIQQYYKLGRDECPINL